MLVYIIDAFNLIHKIDSLKKSTAPHRGLIRYIRVNRLTGSKNNRVIIIFDGKANPEASSDETFEIIFSGSGVADYLIKKKIAALKNKSEVVVVSDDREIRDFAKSQGARCCRTSDFVKTKPPKEKTSDKEISFSLQRQITEEMRKIWLKE